MKKYQYFDEMIATVAFLSIILLAIFSNYSNTLFEYIKNSELSHLIIFTLIPFSIITSLYALKKYYDVFSSRKIDSLTKLDSRESFMNDIYENKASNVVLLNIIDFKTVNKTLGFAQADMILIDIALKLDHIIHKYADSKLYRLYGDEFAFLYDGENIDDVCKKIRNNFEDKFLKFDDVEIHLGLNIAYSNVTPKYFTATLALQDCKKDLNKNVLSYDGLKYNKEKEKKLYYLKVLKDAILNNKIVPVYHGIVDNKTNEIFKYETLARIEQEDNSLLTPYFFIELSKKFKLYPYITKIIIEKAFEKFKDKTSGFTINFSFIDIHNEEILEYFYKKLEDNKETSSRLTIEILETENIGNYNELMQFRDKIKSYGCSLAIDDFGSGYSNWSNILKLKPDFIKIDGSLIKNLLNDDDNINIVKTIVDFCKQNKIKTVAEFVSNKELAILVKELEIDYSQGYYYCEPELLS